MSKNNKNQLGYILGYALGCITLLSLAVCVVAVTAKFLMWLF